MISHIKYVALALILVGTSAFSSTPSAFDLLIPAGWKLISSTTGDLNRDGVEDAALVLEETNPSNIKPNDGLGPPVLNLNPRRLLVLVGTSNGYRKAFSRDDLLPAENQEGMGCLADPLANGGVSIARGNLVIELQDWRSCGSYGVVNEKFTFRTQGTRFQLIGYDRSESSRSTGERSEYSTNYLTGQKKITTGLNDFHDLKPEVYWKRLTAKRAFFLDEISLYCDAADVAQKDNWCQ